jgi:hypothetical protein
MTVAISSSPSSSPSSVSVVNGNDDGDDVDGSRGVRVRNDDDVDDDALMVDSTRRNEGNDGPRDVLTGFWLSKRSDKTKTWNRRWTRVVTNASAGDGRLEFLESPGARKPTSGVALSDVTGCVVSSLNIHGQQGRVGCGIYVEVRGHAEGIFLCADTPSEASEWVSAFRDARARRWKISAGSAAKESVKPLQNDRVRRVLAESNDAERGLVASPGQAESPAGSMDTRGRVLDTFGAMELALQAKDELLAAETVGRSSLESALRSESKLSAELQRKVNSLREQLGKRERELKLVRENLATEKDYATELKEQLDDALFHAQEMEDTAAAAAMEVERLERELTDARSTRERMEEALMSEGDYLRRREAEEHQRQRQLESQLNDARKTIEELESKYETELADVRRRSAHAISVASATEQELLLSRDRLLSELARMRREGYETVLNTSRDSSAPTTPSRTRNAAMPTTPSRLGQSSRSPRRVTFKDSASRAARVHRVRDSPPATPRSHAEHPEPIETPDRTRRTLFDRSTSSRHLDANTVIDRLDSPGTHGCRVQ